MNRIKRLLTVILILNIAACASANNIYMNYKDYESEDLKCGKSSIKIISSCFDGDEGLLDRGSGGVVRECKSIKMYFSKEVGIDLPISNFNEGTQNRKITEGDISPIIFSCLKHNENYYIRLNQGVTNNINAMSEEEFKYFNNSILLNMNGEVLKDEEKRRILKKNKLIKTLPVNAVYGVN